MQYVQKDIDVTHKPSTDPRRSHQPSQPVHLTPHLQTWQKGFDNKDTCGWMPWECGHLIGG
jgi:hypothetical protein